jgi:predicted O-methyltransferase YrrM
LEYIRLIKEIRLKLILELGGGSSSLIAGYQLKLNGEGRLIAIDHEKKWGEITEGNLLRHGLADVAEVRIAPLKAIELNGREYNWYDLKEFEDIVSIDILLIDGPPDTSDGGLRYPGLELLYRRLSHGGVILIDDCVMPRWNKQVLDWAKERGFEVESFYLNEKNTLLLRHNRHVSTWGDGGAGGLE